MTDINGFTKDYFDHVFSPILDDPRINDLGNYTDEEGITHIHVMDTDDVWELVDGQWKAKAPF